MSRSAITSVFYTSAFYFVLAIATPASANSLNPVEWTTHLCLSNCVSPASGSEASASSPIGFHDSVSGSGTSAEVLASASPAPNISAVASAFGDVTDARADLVYKYYFELLGPAGGSAPVTVNATLSVTGSHLGGGHASAFADVTINGESRFISTDSITHIDPVLLHLTATKILPVDQIFWVSLSVDAHAQSSFLGDGANASAWIDPTFTIDPAFTGYSLVFSEGVDNIATPLPASLPLFCGGLGVLGLLGWRSKNKGGALAASA